MTAQANPQDALHPLERITLEFTVTEQRATGLAQVTVAIRGNGYQPQHPGSQLRVNGRVLQEAPLAKQGVWYKAELPVADVYELVYAPAAPAAALGLRLPSREFRPVLPERVARSQGLVLEFAGPALAQGERAHVSLTPQSESARPRWVSPPVQAQGHSYRVAASALHKLALGPAELSVGVIRETAGPQVQAKLMVREKRLVEVAD